MVRKNPRQQTMSKTLVNFIKYTTTRTLEG